jgi:glycerol-3-phosphate dehydrogenase
MRPRDLDRLASTAYDVIVVGGGVYGLAAAYEGAHRGLRVALIDAADFGSGASSSHQTTAYGALLGRPFDRFKQPVGERRALARMAPRLLRPLPFLTGTYRSAAHGRLALRATFKLERWLTKRRNESVEPELHLPATRLVSKAATTRLFPGIRQSNLTGGAQWYEYQILDSDRFVVALAAAADRAGADLANHVEATAPLREGSRIAGVRARDHVTGRQFDIRGRCVINAAGAAAGAVMAAMGVKRDVPLVSTIELVTSKPASDMALVAAADDGQALALVPWRGRATIGPWCTTSRDASAESLDAVIQHANHAFPALALRREEVTRIEQGWLPRIHAGSSIGPPSGYAVFDHGADGADGALTLLGAGFVHARAAAERIVGSVARKLGTRLNRSRSATTSLPGAGIADHEALAIETARRVHLDVPQPLVRHLIGRYAEEAASIIQLMAETDEWSRPLASDIPTVGAEVVHAARSEMATRLSDIVLRRVAFGAERHPGADALRSCARIAAGVLGWDLARETAEINDLERFYERGLKTSATGTGS